MNNEVFKRYTQQKNIRDNIHKRTLAGVKSGKIGVIGLGKSIYKVKKLDKSINKISKQYKPTKRSSYGSEKGHN